MIRLGDATIIAMTKLQTHRVRLSIAITIASLLLAVIATGLFVTAGAFKSIDRFSRQGLNDRYLVSFSIYSMSSGQPNDAMLKRASEIRTQLIAEKTAKAKALGIEYDPKLEEPVILPESYPGQPDILNFKSQAAEMARKEPYEKMPYTWQTAQDVAKKYDAKGLYSFKRFEPFEATPQLMENGREKFSLEPPSYSLDADKFPQGVSILPATLTKPFESVTSPSKDPNAVPVIVPYSYAEKALGYKKLPNNAPAKEKLDRISTVQRGAGEIYVSICFRNEKSASQITEALTAARDQARSKDTPNYQKPDVVYGLPAPDSCGAPVVTRDVRTTAQKKLEREQNELASMTVPGKPIQPPAQPEQRKVVFRVTGIAPDGPSYDKGMSLQSLASTVAGSHLNNQWVVPADKVGPIVPAVQPPAPTESMEDATHVFEFSSAEKAKTFIDEMKCPLANCEDPKREFQLMQFGSNSIIVSQLHSGVMQVLLIAGGVAGVIASIILMAIVGRMIADGRRETAVFRAIGAHRIDIALIYAVYTFLVSLAIGGISVLSAVAAAQALNMQYGGEVTAQALLSFGASDPNRVFSLLSVEWLDALMVIGLALAAGAIGMIIPLLRNVRRNPIKDMRDE